MYLLRLTKLWKKTLEGVHITTPRQIPVDQWQYITSSDEQKERNLVNQLK